VDAAEADQGSVAKEGRPMKWPCLLLAWTELLLAVLLVFLCVYSRPLLFALAGFLFGLAGGVLLAACLVVAISWRGNSAA
jgi:hypothetical protein